jgi:tRNA-uridine 2-sulfurtransferase
VMLRDVNWLGDVALDDLPPEGREIAARVRSTRAPRPGIIRIVAGAPAVELHGPEEGVAPGQACVFYDHAGADARVLGGGTIARDDAMSAAAA